GNQGALHTATVVALATRVEMGETEVLTRDIDVLERGIAAGGNLLLNIGVITDTFMALGDLERAERLARLAQERAAGRFRQTLSRGALGDVLLRLGPSRWDEAQRCYDHAIDLAETLGSRSTCAAVHLGIAELAARRGDHSTCARELRHA